ncbi:GNAT family N-acetyltransferase [Shewanella litorisediminis]|uniref:GNAT family N-acetyltransferase n=1 Tax=Shewanella litorisediminis TaxID=1173586 RepID=A0ABX7FZX5_9GAMM|nr:GNAT family N-acetyltransferase [Shewanella litorisediminis]MCL2918306.1 GNAT family N-acetyltransferase [Shewanella litorisediminis]QRH00645.1 GNAT family N-acetyltransferase [Shewanella litorisediminis]
MQIVPLKSSHFPQIATVFHQAVSAAAGKGYTQAQCEAWSAGIRDKRYWRSRLRRSLVLVARDNDEVLGFIDCELCHPDKGYIGHLYVAPAHQGRGIGGKLIDALVRQAPCFGVGALTTDASLFSHRLFAAKGFSDKGRYFQQKSGQVLPGFAMTLSLPFHIDSLRGTDVASVARLFHEAVQGASEYYSEAERNAWSPALRDEATWQSRLAPSKVWVARGDSGIVGFINLLPRGHGEAEIDCLFTAPAAARSGVAGSLYRVLEQQAWRDGVQRLTVEASYFARPFFLSRGFTELCRNEHPRHGQVLVNFSMEKWLTRPEVG